MTSTPLVVTTIGTCRVADPIHAATKHRPLRRANGRLYGFVHTTREILQQLDTLDGRAIPKALLPFVARMEKASNDLDDGTEVFLVEISTAKEFRFREWFLQINHMERAFADIRPLLEIFRANGAAEARDSRGVLLRRHPMFARVTALRKEILLEAYVHATTREELTADLAEIARRLPAPALFSPHVDVAAADGTPLASRRRFCGWVREACAELGLRLLDPLPYVEAYGTTRALAKGGADLNHYSEPFKAEYGRLLYDRHLLPLARGDAFEPGLAAASQGPPAVTGADAPVADGPDAEALGAEALGADAPDAASRIALAARHLASSRQDDAVALARAVVRDAPADGSALAGAARIFAKAQRHDEAMATFRRLAALRPDRPGPMTDAARSALKAKLLPEALECAEAALALAPDDAGMTFLRIEVLRKMRRTPELADALVAASAAHPEEAMKGVPALLSSGFVAASAAIVAAARKAGVEEAGDSTLQADLAGALRKAAKAAEEVGDVPAAVEGWRSLRLLDPASKAARLGLRNAVAPRIEEARSLAGVGDLPGAAEAYRGALSLDPEDGRARREYASLMERMEDWSAATDAWEALATAAEPVPEALERGARAARKAGRDEDALRFYVRMGEEERVEHAEALDATARRLARAMRAACKAGELDEAMTKVEAVLALDPANEVASRTRGEVVSAFAKRLRATRDDDLEQERLGRRLLAVDPDHPEGLRSLGRLYGNRHDHREAEAVYRRLTDLEPDDPNHQVKLAIALRGLKRYDEGHGMVRRALELAPGHERAIALLESFDSRHPASP